MTIEGDESTTICAFAVITNGTVVPVSVTLSQILYVPGDDCENEYVDELPCGAETPPTDQEYENCPVPPETFEPSNIVCDASTVPDDGDMDTVTDALTVIVTE